MGTGSKYPSQGGFPGDSEGKESAYNVGDLGLIPDLGRPHGEGHGNALQYSCLGNPHGQRSLVGCSPCGRKESDTTEQLSTTQNTPLSFPGGISGKESTFQCKRHKRHGFNPWVRKIPLEEGMATHSSILVWEIPMDRGAWWATVHSIAKSWTQLKQLST